MKIKLKGCRPSDQIRLDWTNTCAEYGAAQFRAKEITEYLPKISERLKEIQLELQESIKQEAELAKETTDPQPIATETPTLELVQ